VCIFVETSGPGVESCGIIWVGGVGVFSSSMYISAPLSRVAASVLGFASEVGTLPSLMDPGLVFQGLALFLVCRGCYIFRIFSENGVSIFSKVPTVVVFSEGVPVQMFENIGREIFENVKAQPSGVFSVHNFANLPGVVCRFVCFLGHSVARVGRDRGGVSCWGVRWVDVWCLYS